MQPVKEFLCLTCFVQNESMREIVMAFLSKLGFDSFEESDKTLKAYQENSTNLIQEIQQPIQDLTDQFQFTVQFSEIKDENWNKKWEENFQPIQIDDFCYIRASFHPKNENCQHDIVINPKMSFGTGHHATTQLMIELMQPHNWNNQSVLDLGCGTGILSILASKLGASQITGVDHIDWAYRNALENVEQNQCNNIQIVHDDVTNLPPQQINIVLANINKGFIQTNLEQIIKFMSPNGVIIFSGILTSDQQEMIDRAKDFDLTLLSQKNKDIWSAFSMKK